MSRPEEQFIFRLALLLGKTCGEIRHTMSCEEFFGWMVYFNEIEIMPDPTRSAAQICAVIANANRGKGRAYRAQDFMPRLGRKRKQSAEEMMAAFDRMGK